MNLLVVRSWTRSSEATTASVRHEPWIWQPRGGSRRVEALLLIHWVVKTAGLLALLLALGGAFVTPRAAPQTTPPAAPATVTGATINPKAARVEICVDPFGEDTNAGTPGSPLKTIRAAVRRAITNQDNGQSVKIRIAGGVYRESLNLDARLPVKGKAVIIIEPADKERVTLTGADEFKTDWLFGAENIYRSLLPCGLEPLGDGDVTMGRAVIYVNDTPYWLVSERAKLRPYHAYIEPVTQHLYLHPPAGFTPRQMAEARIEIVRRTFLLRIARPNVMVRGMRFIRSSLLGGIVSGTDILLEDSDFVQNASTGLLVEDSEAVTLRGLRISRNASAGLFVRRTRNLAARNLEVTENDDGNPEAERAGIILTRVRDATFAKSRILHNRAHGLRIEDETGGITLSECRITNNLRSGITGELAGPLTITGTRISHNTRGLEVIGGSVALSGCTIASNTDAQVRIMMGAGPTTWETTTLASENGVPLVMAAPQDEATWKAFLAAFHGEKNHYLRAAPGEKRPDDFSPASAEEWSRLTEGRDKSPTLGEAAQEFRGALTLSEDKETVIARFEGAKSPIVRIGFYDRNRYLWGEATKSPYVLPLSSLPSGEHVLTAWATDKEGEIYSSSPLTVTVP